MLAKLTKVPVNLGFVKVALTVLLVVHWYTLWYDFGEEFNIEPHESDKLAALIKLHRTATALKVNASKVYHPATLTSSQPLHINHDGPGFSGNPNWTNMVTLPNPNC